MAIMIVIPCVPMLFHPVCNAEVVVEAGVNEMTVPHVRADCTDGDVVNIPRKGDASRCKGIICFNCGTGAEIPFWIKTNEVWYSVIGDSVMYYVMYQRKIVTDGFHCHCVFPRTSTI